MITAIDPQYIFSGWSLTATADALHKRFLLTSGNIDCTVVAHDNITTFPADITFYAVKVYEEGMMDPKKITVLENVLIFF